VVDFDVVVLGSGFAGLRAAIAASEGGASVLVIEAQADVGGRSQYSSAGIMAAGTRFQRALGIEDSADLLFEQYQRANHWQIDAGVAHRLAHGCATEVEWLADQGLEIKGVLPSPDSDVPRTHRTPGGQAIIELLRTRARAQGCEFAVGRRVERLVVTDGVVTGVATADEELVAGAVVLATGGLGGNPDLLRRFAPSLVAATGDWLVPVGGRELAPYASGDAIGLAEGVGAALAGIDMWEATIRPGYVEVSSQMLPGWVMVVDRSGRRVVDETAGIVAMQSALLVAGGEVYAVFDEAAREAGDPPPTPAGASRPRRINPDWRPEVIEAMVRDGKVVRAETLAGLADQIGVPATGLQATVGRYNGFVADGADLDHRKDPAGMRPIGDGPYYAVALRLGSVAYTSAGPRIDADAQVIGADNAPIPGLYAAGECAGGVVGMHMAGNPVASCLVFGRVAGAGAAQFARALSPQASLPGLSAP
jgi:succinate dehydrogenase/fumarate reductase flavoprotein subunit